MRTNIKMYLWFCIQVSNKKIDVSIPGILCSINDNCSSSFLFSFLLLLFWFFLLFYRFYFRFSLDIFSLERHLNGSYITQQSPVINKTAKQKQNKMEELLRWSRIFASFFLLCSWKEVCLFFLLFIKLVNSFFWHA